MRLYHNFCNRFFGPCISEQKSARSIFITFDDGPDPSTTPQVLAILKNHGVHATFFVVVNKAAKESELISQILGNGHAIGNHSLDHKYRPLFSSKETLRLWIEKSHVKLTNLIGKSPVGFRSPAGVRTPELHSILRDLNISLIHWNTRFFDSTRRWNTQKADEAVKHLAPGSIVLLHDAQKSKNRESFLKTLDYFIGELVKKGFQFEVIPN